MKLTQGKHLRELGNMMNSYMERRLDPWFSQEDSIEQDLLDDVRQIYKDLREEQHREWLEKIQECPFSDLEISDMPDFKDAKRHVLDCLKKGYSMNGIMNPVYFLDFDQNWIRKKDILEAFVLSQIRNIELQDQET